MDEIITYVNEMREKEGLDPLTIDSELQQIAMQRAIQMKDDFSHKYSITDGENIAYANYKLTSKELYQGWYDSEGHRKEFLRKDIKSAACAVYRKNNCYYYCYVGSDDIAPKRNAP